MVARIRDRINLLELDSLAKMGRPGLVTGTRELIEYPYIIVYEIDSDRREVSVLTIVHGARDREDQER
jgi:toxin ParE1/3/4